jgi:hypothetical protein
MLYRPHFIFLILLMLLPVSLAAGERMPVKYRNIEIHNLEERNTSGSVVCDVYLEY